MTTTAERAFVVAAQRLPTLFDLTEEAYRLLAILDDEIDENHEVEAQLALIDQMLIEKVDGYVSVIRSLESMAAARKVEADRLRDRAQRAQKHADFLKGRLLEHMLTTGRTRAETGRFTLSIRQNPPSVNVVDAAVVPSEFQRTKIEITVDKRLVLDWLKTTGEVVPGTEVVRTERLSIA